MDSRDGRDSIDLACLLVLLLERKDGRPEYSFVEKIDPALLRHRLLLGRYMLNRAIRIGERTRTLDVNALANEFADSGVRVVHEFRRSPGDPVDWKPRSGLAVIDNTDMLLASGNGNCYRLRADFLKFIDYRDKPEGRWLDFATRHTGGFSLFLNDGTRLVYLRNSFDRPIELTLCSIRCRRTTNGNFGESSASDGHALVSRHHRWYVKLHDGSTVLVIIESYETTDTVTINMSAGGELRLTVLPRGKIGLSMTRDYRPSGNFFNAFWHTVLVPPSDKGVAAARETNTDADARGVVNVETSRFTFIVDKSLRVVTTEDTIVVENDD